MGEIKSKLIKEKIKQVYHTCKCRHVPQTPAKNWKNQITNVLEYFCLFGRNYIHFYNSGLNSLISHYLSSRKGGGGARAGEEGGVTWFSEWRWGDQSSSTESRGGRLQKINCQQEIIISSCQLTDHEEGPGIHQNIKSLIRDQVNFIMTHQNPLPPLPSPSQAVNNDRFLRMISEWHFNMSFRTPQKWLTCNLY